jgi:hypothetical protein
MANSEKNYFTPLIEVCNIVAERGYAGSMLEDPIEQPEQGW